jgi:hypothetical protein
LGITPHIALLACEYTLSHATPAVAAAAAADACPVTYIAAGSTAR